MYTDHNGGHTVTIILPVPRSVAILFRYCYKSDVSSQDAVYFVLRNCLNVTSSLNVTISMLRYKYYTTRLDFL